MSDYINRVVAVCEDIQQKLGQREVLSISSLYMTIGQIHAWAKAHLEEKEDDTKTA